MDNTKCCTKCSTFLPIGAFRVDSKGYITRVCKKCYLTYCKQHRTKNKDKIKKQKAEWIQRNKESLSLRYRTDVQFKLTRLLRGRLHIAVKNCYKSGSAVRDLGCSIEDLKQYIESRWQPGMSWNNYCRKGWHIDHIKPLASFDLSDPEQFKQACHYTNLQPLWAVDNLSKGGK